MPPKLQQPKTQQPKRKTSPSITLINTTGDVTHKKSILKKKGKKSSKRKLSWSSKLEHVKTFDKKSQVKTPVMNTGDITSTTTTKKVSKKSTKKVISELS